MPGRYRGMFIDCPSISLTPRTAALGAVLLTGLLGGAVATHLRIENPLFSHTVFPLYVGSFMWGGLWLRNAQVRALLPLLVGNNRARSAS
jgi:hypothetical protein